VVSSVISKRFFREQPGGLEKPIIDISSTNHATASLFFIVISTFITFVCAQQFCPAERRIHRPLPLELAEEAAVRWNDLLCAGHGTYS